MNRFNMMKKISAFLVAGFCLAVMQVQAAPDFNQQLLTLQERWAHINYEVPKSQKEAEFEKLAAQLKEFGVQNPDRAEPLIWRGIVLSTWAGAKGGLGALGLVKDARALFEQSLAVSQDALQGSAYTSLGSLYYQVPGWPVAFGDDKKAAELLQKAITINADGIDSNYFYGDYWLEQGEYQKARQYLEKALQAPDRPGRPLADAGRRQEIKSRLAQVEDKLN